LLLAQPAAVPADAPTGHTTPQHNLPSATLFNNTLASLAYVQPAHQAHQPSVNFKDHQHNASM
jgi:hypothetical protein